MSPLPSSAYKCHWSTDWEMWRFLTKCSLLLGSNFASQSSGSKEKGSRAGPLQPASAVFGGRSCVCLGLLHRFDKFLDFFFQGLVPPLNILPGALHIAEADFQGCRLLLLFLQFFIEPYHLSPDVIIFLLKATRKERREWKNWVLPLHCPFIFAHNLFCPFSFLYHKTHTHPVPLIYVLTPTWALPRKPEFPEHVWAPILSFITILRHPLCCCFSCHFTSCIFLQILTSLEKGTTSNIRIFSPPQHPAFVLLKRNVDWWLKPHPHSRFPTPLHVWAPSHPASMVGTD